MPTGAIGGGPACPLGARRRDVVEAALETEVAGEAVVKLPQSSRKPKWVSCASESGSPRPAWVSVPHGEYRLLPVL